jgi:hypothetical protein
LLWLLVFLEQPMQSLFKTDCYKISVFMVFLS